MSHCAHVSLLQCHSSVRSHKATFTCLLIQAPQTNSGMFWVFSACGKSQHFAEDCSILYMRRGKWFGRDVKRTDICRRDETVTVGTRFLRKTSLVDRRNLNLLGLIAYWIAWFYLKFCWSSWLVYIHLIRKTSFYVSVFVSMTLLTLKNLLSFMKLAKMLCHLRPRRVKILNFPNAAVWPWGATALFTILKLFTLMGS